MRGEATPSAQHPAPTGTPKSAANPSTQHRPQGIPKSAPELTSPFYQHPLGPLQSKIWLGTKNKKNKSTKNNSKKNQNKKNNDDAHFLEYLSADGEPGRTRQRILGVLIGSPAGLLRGLPARPVPAQARVRCAELGAGRAVQSYTSP